MVAWTIATATPALASGSHAACQVSERDFIGYWRNSASTADDSEEIQFGREGRRRIYRSWLHQRPEVFGSWTFAACRVRVSGPSGIELTYRFNANNKRRLIEVDSGSIYRRMR